MGALKALVIGMGVLIIIGMTMVAYGMFRQASKLTGSQSFDEASIAVPVGCTLAQVTPGDRGLLVLRLEGAAEDGCRQLILFDGRRGELRGRIHLTSP